MIPLVSIVGKSNSGKTTLVEKLIYELKQRGYKVATIKHNRHGFDIDHEGKDSWRHKTAGARMTVIASPEKVAVIEDVDRDYEIEELVEHYIHDVDIVLVEGFKRNIHPKIEVFRKELKRELMSINDESLLAVASDQPLDIDVPCFDINDSRTIADFIEETIIRKRER
ncbi:MAG TPA: molybdopterin-guanine dinucleotide biosynthesis protein B [Deltaproteobacteria bacterium]|nr:molybdopterin-guanine dinucleotide biosynthesis protein B [Deltaproteobacteria bacterium]